MSARAAGATAPGAAAPAISFVDCFDDDRIFGAYYSPKPSWAAWRTIAKSLFAEPLTAAELAVFTKLTGRRAAPSAPFKTAALVAGRRAGKSLFTAGLATYCAVFRDYRAFIKPGHRAVVLVVAADRAQAGEAFAYIAAFFKHSEVLAGLLAKEPSGDTIHLKSGVIIQIATSSYRTVRGRTVVCAVLDEVCFWVDDATSKNPAREVVNAIIPSTATIPNSLVVMLSSPYAKSGVMYEWWKKNYAVEGAPTLVVQAPTETLNPSIPRDFLAAEYERDPVVARSEYGALWREDVQGFVSEEAVARVTVKGRLYLPPDGAGRFFAFCDPATGAGQDSMVLAIAKREGGKAVLCRIVERRPPFSPEEVAAEFAEVVKEYGLGRVTGDHFAKGWVGERFKACGISYDVTETTASDYYTQLLYLIMEGRCELLDDQRLIGQLLALERRVGPSGKDLISHPDRAHDGVINAAAGALALASGKRRMLEYLVEEYLRGQAPVAGAEDRAEAARREQEALRSRIAEESGSYICTREGCATRFAASLRTPCPACRGDARRLTDDEVKAHAERVVREDRERREREAREAAESACAKSSSARRSWPAPRRRGAGAIRSGCGRAASTAWSPGRASSTPPTPWTASATSAETWRNCRPDPHSARSAG